MTGVSPVRENPLRQVLDNVNKFSIYEPSYAVTTRFLGADGSELAPWGTAACFASALSWARKFAPQHPERLLLAYKLPSPFKLPPETRRRWLELGCRTGYLPPHYWVDDLLATEEVTINFQNKELSEARAYATLSWVRWMRDNESFVRAVLQLVDEAGCDVDAAVAYSAGFLLSSGHSFIPWSGRARYTNPYLQGRDSSANVFSVRLLRKARLSPHFGDTAALWGAVERGCWQVESRVFTAKPQLRVHHHEALLLPELTPLYDAENDAEVFHLATCLQKKGPHALFHPEDFIGSR